MKKAAVAFALFGLISGASLSFQSCNKIKDEIAKQIDPFNFSSQSVTYTVPILTNTSEQSASETVNININELVKENAGIDISIDNVTGIKVKSITMNIENADTENNWTNFDFVKATVQTATGSSHGKAPISWTKNIPDDAAQAFMPQVLQPADGINLKDYFVGDGENVTYTINVKARRATTKALTVNAVVEYEISFN